MGCLFFDLIMMMPFSIGIGLERVWAIGLDQGYWWAELEDAGPFGPE